MGCLASYSHAIHNLAGEMFVVPGRQIIHVGHAPYEPPRSKLRGIQPWLVLSERCKQQGIKPVME